MASGLAKRFGSNKLLAEFDGKPLLCRAFAVTEGLHRVVVTRSTEVQALCEKYGIPVLHHAHPLRSDTVRLGLEYLLPRFPAMSGCVFLPGDQPLLTRETLCGMVSAFCAEPDRKFSVYASRKAVRRAVRCCSAQIILRNCVLFPRAGAAAWSLNGMRKR